MRRFTWSGMSTSVAQLSFESESKVTQIKFSDGYFGSRLMHKVLTRAAVLASWCMCRKTGISCSFIFTGVWSDSIIDATLEHMLIAKVFDWAANWTLAQIAASTSTVSWLSKARRIAWCTCCFSGMMEATDPRALNVSDLATGSFEWITIKILFTNSSTFVIFSKCFSLCWQTRSTHNRNKFEPSRKNSASFKKFELMTMGNGYFSKSFGNLTIASHCSPIFVDRSPKKTNKNISNKTLLMN